MRALVLLPAIVFGGCATTPPPVPPQNLAKPNSRLMATPEPLPEMKPGDSIYTDSAVCRAKYGELSSQVVGLQNWSSVVTRSKR